MSDQHSTWTDNAQKCLDFCPMIDHNKGVFINYIGKNSVIMTFGGRILCLTFYDMTYMCIPHESCDKWRSVAYMCNCEFWGGVITYMCICIVNDTILSKIVWGHPLEQFSYN